MQGLEDKLKKRATEMRDYLEKKARNFPEPVKKIGRRFAEITGGRKKLAAAVLTFAVICAVGIGMASYISAPPEIAPDAFDAVSVEQSFFSDSGSVLLYTDGRIGLRYLRKNLKTVNDESFSISQITDRVFSVRFASMPDPGKTILLQLQAPRGYGVSRQFALHTKVKSPAGSLQVKLVCAGQTNSASVDEPILLLFSKEIPLTQLEKHFVFHAGGKTSIQLMNNVAVIQPEAPLAYDKEYKLTVSSGLEVDGQVLRQSYRTQFRTAAQPVFGSQELQAVNFEQPIVPEIKELSVNALFSDSPAGSFDPNASISLVFSDPIEQSALEGSLSISPAIDYTLSVTDRAAVIKPSSPLKFGAKYTVTVFSGLESINGALLKGSFKTSITVQDSKLSLSLTNQESNVVNVAEPLRLEFAVHNTESDHQLADVTLLRMNNYEQYRTLLAQPKIEQDYDLLEISSTTEVLRNGLNTVEMENPGIGIYMVRVDTTDPSTNLPLTFYKCLNVTDLSVYLQTVQDRTTVWVNSTAVSAAQRGLKVQLSDRTTKTLLAEGTTGQDGSCELVYSSTVPKTVREKQTDGVLSILNASGQVIYVDTTISINSGFVEPEDTARYYTFFFSDRTLYHPTDTIQFWGFVKPYLLNSEPMPQTVRVFFDRNGLEQYVDVALTPDGVFSGEMDIEKVQSLQYNLEAYLYDPAKEEEKQLLYLDSIWMEARDFEKPSFVLSVDTAKELFSSPEQVEITAKLTFYDGTPVPQYPLEIEIMNLEDGNVQEVKKGQTDASGTVRFLFKPDAGIGKRMENGPVRSYFTVTLAQDGETVRKRGSYFYQAAGIVADTQTSLLGTQQVQLTVRTNAPASQGVSAEQLRLITDQYWEYGGDSQKRLKEIYRVLAGPTTDVGVKGSLAVSYTDQMGRSRSETFPISAMTKAGVLQENYKLEVPYDPKYNVNAEVQISCVDNNLNLIASQWSSNSQAIRQEYDYEPSNELTEGYSLAVFQNNNPEPMLLSLNYMGQNDQTVNMDDLLTFQLYRDGVPVENEGKLLYQLIQQQPLSRHVTTESRFQLRENLNYAQSVHVIAAYFDGKTVHPVRDTTLRLNISSVELQVDIRPDKQSYRPGETARLQFHVSDQSGKPVAGNLCISVVDESIFALKEQQINVAEDLYNQMAFPSIYVRKYTTALGDMAINYTGGDGGKGGDGIESYDVIRENFKDTAFFYPTKTDASGNALVSFKLPDNITSWRVTTVSIGGNLYGGSNKENMITTMPFFSKPVITSKYLVGDEVVMLAQGHGTLLSDDAQIDYQVRIEGDAIDQTLTASGKAFEPVRVSLGKLEAGEYTVSSTAQYGQYRDTVVLPLTVIPSNLEMVVNRQVDPQKLSELNVMRYPVTLTFFDKEHAAFYKSISSLLTHFCNRADQRLSRYTAKKALKKYMPVKQIPYYVMDTGGYIADMQCADGGIGWYPGEDKSDPILTTKVLLAVGEQFSSRRMIRYFERMLEQAGLSGVTKSAVYAGLARLKPETTAEINRILESDSIPMQERLYYLLGLAVGGDREQALSLYRRDVEPYLKASGDGKYMAFTGKKETDDELTATVWMLVSKLKLPEADAIALYFSSDRWGIEHIFECMVYVDSYDKVPKRLTPIRYSVNGVPKVLSLGTTGQASESYNKSEWESLQLGRLPEELMVLAYYIGEPSDVEMEPSADITISKLVEKREDESYLNTITISFADTAPTGYYDISDWIPSNMRFFGMKQHGGVSYEQELQKMYFNLYRSSSKDSTYTISYITRKTFDAQTMQDRTYIIHADSGQYNFAERKQLSF